MRTRQLFLTSENTGFIKIAHQMGKRAFDDEEARTAPLEKFAAIENSAKKRKVKVPEAESIINNGAVERKTAKEERTDLKRLRKIRKEQDSESIVGKEVLPINGVEEGVGELGNIGDKAPGKSEKKAEKARLKAAKKLAKSNANKSIGSSTVSPEALAPPPMTQSPSTAAQDTSAAQSSYEEDPTLTVLPQSDIDSYLLVNYIRITDPTSSTILRPITSFSQLPKAATKFSPFTNFKFPTPIQSAAWPFLLSGRDVVGVAETGSGKTLAFGVPCIRSITATPRSQKSSPATKAVIVSPTRELAVQIHDQISQLASAAGLRSVVVYGGVPKDPQRLAVPTAHVIVATPGRLNDLISEGAANLNAVTYLVLDEADRMLDKGFEPDIRKILACTPNTGARQTLMFTATWPPSVRALASSFMRDPVHISIGKDNPSGALRANTSITQLVEVIAPFDKEQRLLQLIKQHQSGTSANDRILVFCLYKKEATRVEGFLRSRGLRVAAIHGDLGQEKRSASLDAFKKGDCPLLVATDVAARGLDIPAVKLVLNMTFPLTVEDYVHRIGRYASLLRFIFSSLAPIFPIQSYIKISCFSSQLPFHKPPFPSFLSFKPNDV